MLRWLLAPLVLLFALIAGDADRRTQLNVLYEASQSIVRITSGFDADPDEAPYGYACTGVVVAHNRVLTDAHCINWDMRADDRPVRLLAVNAFVDLALLSVEIEKPIIKIRDRQPERYESLIAIGYANGEWKLTAVPELVLLLTYAPETDMPLVGPVLVLTPGVLVQNGYIGGMSGGPVIDREGQMVSIVQRTGYGGGYGVMAETIRTFLRENL